MYFLSSLNNNPLFLYIKDDNAHELKFNISLNFIKPFLDLELRFTFLVKLRS